jgi:hypothetical protein
MKRHRERYIIPTILVVAIAVLLLAAVAQAQSGGDYDLSWWTVDGGGTMYSTGGDYSLGGTAGQPDSAVWSGGGYSLAGGFWGGVGVDYRIYLPLVLRNF